MKNLLIYLNPDGFDEESAKLIKLQIDNSLELLWKPDDIVLVTDFVYDYRGIKAVVIDKGFCSFKKEASKITGIVHLFDIGFFQDGTIYWCHDLDAYQLETITEEELGLSGLDAGFNDYCRIPQWQLGSFFFKKGAEDIFRSIAEGIKPGVDEFGKLQHDEFVLLHLTDNNVNNINSRIKRLNTTYDFGMRKVEMCYERAIKPLKILHFHPHNKMINTLAIAMYGKNRIKKPLMNERLIKIFQKYGYT